MRILVTGGAGFIGSAFVRQLLEGSGHEVLCFDKLTYAGSRATFAPHTRFRFVEGDVCDAVALRAAIIGFCPDAIVHLAAESHVDRSIDTPLAFVHNNVLGTAVLLEEARRWWSSLAPAGRSAFRFVHVSTDEVYGALGDESVFTETSRYDPRSPYAASKAAADHLVRAWAHSYGLPAIVTHSSNNYGPRQCPEKLIPLMIARAVSDAPLPVYGKGGQVRDWLFVDDHAHALRLIVEHGQPGRTYNVGADNPHRNIEVVEAVCRILDRLRPRDDGAPHADRIAFVTDRPGHDWRYAIDASRLRDELGWRPQTTFADGLCFTVSWYLANEDWWRPFMTAGALDRRGRLT